MKNEKIKEFLTKLAQEECFKVEFLKLKEKVEKKGFSKKDNEKFISECLLPWSKKLGYKLTKKDFIDFDRTQKPTEITGLSPAELENVSGGGFTMLFALFAMFGSALAGGIGGGDSTNKNQKKGQDSFSTSLTQYQQADGGETTLAMLRDGHQIGDSILDAYTQPQGTTGIASMDYGLEYDGYEATYGETPVDLEMSQNDSAGRIQTNAEPEISDDFKHSDLNQNVFLPSGTPLVTTPETGSQEQAPGLFSHIGNTLWAGVNKLGDIVHNYAENYMKNYGETSVEEYDRHHGETPADFGSGAAGGGSAATSASSNAPSDWTTDQDYLSSAQRFDGTENTSEADFNNPFAGREPIYAQPGLDSTVGKPAGSAPTRLLGYEQSSGGFGTAEGAGTTVSEASQQAQPTPAGDTSSPINPSTRHDGPEQTGAAAGQAGGESATTPTAPKGSTHASAGTSSAISGQTPVRPGQSRAIFGTSSANSGTTPANIRIGAAEGAGTTVSEASQQAQPTPAGDTSSPINPSTRHDGPEQTGAAEGAGTTRPTAPQGSTGIDSMDYGIEYDNYEANYGETPADFATGAAEGDAAGDGGQSVLSQSPQTPNSTPANAPSYQPGQVSIYTGLDAGGHPYSSAQKINPTGQVSIYTGLDAGGHPYSSAQKINPKGTASTNSSQSGRSWKDDAKEFAKGMAQITGLGAAAGGLALGIPVALGTVASALSGDGAQQKTTDKTKETSKKTEEKKSVDKAKIDDNDFMLRFKENLQKNSPESFQYFESLKSKEK